MQLDDGTYGSPRWSWEILDCAMPMTFDTYSNCAHQCVYCFAFFQRAVGDSKDAYLHHKVKAVDTERVKKMFIEPDKYAGQFASYIKNRFVLQWGGLSDGFDWYERKFRKSLDMLRFFVEIDYPISISTKGTWFVDDPEYREVLKGATNTHWKYSIITTSKEHAAKLEAGTPSPDERFLALKKLGDLGVGATTLRYRPFIIGVSDICDEEMFAKAVEAGCYSVTTEFLCIEKRASENHHERYRIMSDVVGYDVFDYYKRNSYSGSGLMRLNYDIKRPYIKRMQDLSDAYNIPFFVSDAHHKEASAGAGCCGLPNEGPLSVYNKGQYSHAIQLAKQNGSVRWSDIAEEAAWLRDLQFVAAEGYNQGDTYNRAKNKYHSMYDFMRDIWNKPKSWQSPARYFGGALVPSEVDENGDIIYLYNKPFIEDGIRVESVPELARMLADQRDQMEKDGGQFGHIAYPIFVPTRGRAGAAKVLEVLDAERIPYTLVVEKEDLEAYQEAYPTAGFLVLPESNRGIWFARQFILDHCREEGLEWYWQIDDNIKGFKESEGRGNKDATARAALSYAEALSGDYENLKLVALDYQQFAFRHDKPWSVNKIAACCVLTNTKHGANYREEANLKEDIDFHMQLIREGFSTITVHRFAMDKPTMGVGGTGGNRDAYRAGQNSRSALFMAETWPHMQIIKKKQGLDVRIDWKEFPNTLRLASGLRDAVGQ